MYLADNNDTLPPGEHRQEVIDYFDTQPGTRGGYDTADWSPEDGGHCWNAYEGNPYLRWPVIMDEYVKNRDVWRCPSAKVQRGASIIIPDPDWLRYYETNPGWWGWDEGQWSICDGGTWPPGWGGDVTDTVLQQRVALDVSGGSRGTEGVSKVFVLSIACGEESSQDVKLVEVQDPVRYAIVADAGAQTKVLTVGTTAYPDICCAECAGITWYANDWPVVSDPIKGIVDCPQPGGGDYCGAADPATCVELHAKLDWMKDPDRRKASTRHLGGVNIGFLDGHASWVNSERLLTLVADDEIEGLVHFCGFGGCRAGYEAYCGPVPAGAEFLY